MPRPYRTVLLIAAIGAALGVPAAQAGESGGRLLYFLNCSGCHPMPDRDPGALGGAPAYVGGFYQTETGRRFFIRMPPAGSPPLGAAEDARLVDEILTWKRACLALTASTPLIRYRGP